MEMYVYYSIIIFGIIIVSLYCYIIWIKTFEHYTNWQKRKHENLLIPLTDTMVSDLIPNNVTNFTQKDALISTVTKNKLKKLVVENRIIYHLEMLQDHKNEQLIHFCEVTGIIDHELKELSKSNLYAKALACKKLGELRSKKSVPYLLTEVNSLSQDVIYNALLALAKIGDEQAFIKAFENINASILLSERSLIEVVDSFEGDKALVYSQMIDCDNEFVSCIFIKSAGSYRDDAITSQIAAFLKGHSKERTIAAIKALKNTNNSIYIIDILNLLTDENWEIRAMAAKALDTYQNSEVIHKLITALSDNQWFVRYNAASSLLSLDKNLSYIAKVFEGEDKFAKDILILAMENNNSLSLLLDDTKLSNDIAETTVLLIRNYIKKGGGIKND